MNILFVCHSNINRSKTFELYFERHYPNHIYRSAGCYCGHPYLADTTNLAWADLVFVMDLTNFKFIYDKYPNFINKCHTIGIPDQFEYGDPGLLELIKFWAENMGWVHIARLESRRRE